MVRQRQREVPPCLVRHVSPVAVSDDWVWSTKARRFGWFRLFGKAAMFFLLLFFFVIFFFQTLLRSMYLRLCAFRDRRVEKDIGAVRKNKTGSSSRVSMGLHTPKTKTLTRTSAVRFGCKIKPHPVYQISCRWTTDVTTQNRLCASSLVERRHEGVAAAHGGRDRDGRLDTAEDRAIEHHLAHPRLDRERGEVEAQRRQHRLVVLVQLGRLENMII